jgi:hypothetical protein
MLKGTPNNLLRNSIAALRGARFLAYLNDMFRSLRSVRLALKSLTTILGGSRNEAVLMMCKVGSAR